MGLLDDLFGEKKRQYTRPEPLPYPSAEEVEAAREYKRRFGNSNEQAIEAPPTPYNPAGNVRYQTPGLLSSHLPANLAADVVNEGLLAKVPKSVNDPATADALYAAQIAAQRSPLGYLGFDRDTIVPTRVGDPGDKLTAVGAYSGKSDRIWADLRDPSSPVHESLHRAISTLRQQGLIGKGTAEEEMWVRALMLRHHGDIEGGGGSLDAKQVQQARDLMKNPDFVKRLDTIERLAHEEIARRNLEKGPL